MSSISPGPATNADAPQRTLCCRCSARPAVYLIRPHELGLCRPCYLWVIHGEYAYEQPSEPVTAGGVQH